MAGPGPLDYIALGWHIFPCHTIQQGRCSCTKGVSCVSPGKHPRTQNGVKDASTDPDVIRKWMQRYPETNWGLACGHVSGVVVLDADQRKGGLASLDDLETNRPDGPMPQTRRAKSGGGGKHLFFRYPTDGQPIGNRVDFRPGIDFRSDGGYVILPNGTHISGGRYEWINFEHDMAPMPSDILAAIRGGRDGSSRDPLPDLAEILAGVPEGKRDDTLFRAACKLRRELGNDSTARTAVESIILRAAAACDFPEKDALRKVEQAYAQDHADGLEPATYWSAGGVDGGDDDDIGGNDHELYPLTDLGNVMRLISIVGYDWRFVPEWGWVRFTDLGWRKVTEHEILQVCAKVHRVVAKEHAQVQGVKNKAQWGKWVQQCQSSARIAAVEALARSHEHFLATAEEFDTNPHELACPNGIVDLQTGEIRQMMQEDFVTKNTMVVYDPESQSDRWERFLDDITDGDEELKRYLQMMAGYFLTGLTHLEAFYFILGVAATGKSTFIDAISSAMGSYAMNTASDTFMYRRGKDTPAQELARMPGCRLVYMSEIREGDFFNEALIKQFTGGDKIVARMLYRVSFEFKPQAKLAFITNHEPSTRDDAMMRRLKKIEFLKPIPAEKRDPTLKLDLRDPDKLGPAVLAWMVKGAQMMYDQPLWVIPEPEVVKKAVREYQETHDDIRQFMHEVLVNAEGDFAPVAQVYDEYRQWCEVNGEKLLSHRQFWQRMRERGLNRDRINETDVYVNVRSRTRQINAIGVSTWV